MKILLIIPAFNEEKNLDLLLAELDAYRPSYDILVVDDGSTDGTPHTINRHNVPAIRMRGNNGIGRAMKAGFTYAVENGFDLAVQVDGDGQHDPAWIETLVQPIINGQADIVIGSRFIEKHTHAYRHSPIARRIGMFYSTALLYLACGIYITDTTSGFRAMNRKALEFLKGRYPEKHPDAEALLLLIRAGFKILEAPVTMRPRRNGRSMFTMASSVRYPFHVLLRILRVTFTRQKHGYRTTPESNHTVVPSEKAR